MDQQSTPAVVGEPVRLALGKVAPTGYDRQLEPTSAVGLLDEPLLDDPPVPVAPNMAMVSTLHSP